MVRGRAFWAVLTGYTILRLALLRGVHPFTDWPDTASYKAAPSFIGNAERLWFMPLINALLPDGGVIVFQTVLSAVAFVVVGFAIASTLTNRYIRVGMVVVVLLLGVSDRIVMWDQVIMADSLTVSTTLLLIAALAWIDRIPWWAIIAVFTAWLFTRDSHVLLGVLVVAAIAWRARARREWLLSGAMAAVLVWGYAASANDRYVEGYNIATHVVYRFDDGQRAWMVDHGMPSAELIPAGIERATDFEDRTEQGEVIHALWADAEFRQWAETDGAGAYVRYAVTHPGYLLGAFRYLVAEYDPLDQPSMLDATRQAPPADTASIDTIWPPYMRDRVGVLIIVAALATVLPAARRRIDAAWILPSLLAGSTLVQALLVYHGSAIELNRHSLTLALGLVLSLWWLIALGLDRALDTPLRGEVRLDRGDVTSGHRAVSDNDDLRDVAIHS